MKKITPVTGAQKIRDVGSWGGMLQNPVMANLAHALEAVQVTGVYRLMGSLPTGSAGGSQATGQVQQMNLMPLLQAIDSLGQRLDKQGSRPVQLNYRAFEEFTDQVD